TELFLHHELVVEHVLGGGDAAGGLVAHHEAGALVIGADHAHHDERDQKRRVHALPAGRGLDEIGGGHHADQRGGRHVAHGLDVTGRKDRLHVGIAAGTAEVTHLVIERLPVAGQHMLASDDDVDLPGAVTHRGFDLLQLHVVRHQAGG